MRKLLYLLAFSVIISHFSINGQVTNINGLVQGIKPESSNSTQDSTIKVRVSSTSLNQASFLQKVWNYQTSPQEWKYLGDKPAIIDFYADWCGPCKVAAPVLEEIANDYAGTIVVYKIDTQKEQELAAIFGIRSIPAFLYIPLKGKPAMMAGIPRAKQDIKKTFEENISRILLVSKTK